VTAVPDAAGALLLDWPVHDSLRRVSAEEHENQGRAPDGAPAETDPGGDPSEEPTLQPGEVTEGDLASARQDLEAQLEAARNEASEIKDRWMRAAADLENFRKRAAKEREELQKFANERLLRDFLPVFDDLERALGVLDTVEGGGAGPVRDGVEMVRKKFIQQLERHGVEPFDSVGEPFDPARHDAIQQAHSNEVEAGCILEELQRGFMLRGRLLRPAMVVVSLGPESAEN